jgi:hypothetical protein
MGRPKKTTKEFPDGWQKYIMNLYAQGGCDVEVRSYLGGISNGLFYRLVLEDEEFSQIIKKGRIHSEAWWREQGRRGIGAGKVNVGMYALNMRNRFGWFDANKQGEDISNIGEKLDKLAGAIGKSDTNSD